MKGAKFEILMKCLNLSRMADYNLNSFCILMAAMNTPAMHLKFLWSIFWVLAKSTGWAVCMFLLFNREGDGKAGRQGARGERERDTPAEDMFSGRNLQVWSAQLSTKSKQLPWIRLVPNDQDLKMLQFDVHISKFLGPNFEIWQPWHPFFDKIRKKLIDLI